MNTSVIEAKLIDLLKTNSVTVPIYRKLKTLQNKKRFKVNSINTFKPCRDTSNEIRYNLVLPSLRTTRVFAGISSALSFFLSMTVGASKCRIIIIGNENFDKNTTYHVEGYDHSPQALKQLVFISENDELRIGENDIFVLTSWKTAISFIPVICWQKSEYNLKTRKFIYLIQDFEPGFFPWSTEYVLAESTYLNTSEDIIAVFNSHQLFSFFKARGYQFGSMLYFQPVLNPVLKKKLLQEMQRDHKKRKKRIIIYGRPSEARNAFEIIRFSLELWSANYKNAKEWEILSLGEGFDDIELNENTIVSKGKLTLDEYADIMLSAYAGISLMISPHPSYPPLEMSTFGVRTITNQFEGKDLQNFNDNIISVPNCAPELISNTLMSICDDYDTFESRIASNKEYLEGDSIRETINNALAAVLETVERYDY